MYDLALAQIQEGKKRFCMSALATREVLRAVHSRYRGANRQEKRRILDEFVATIGYHRRYDIQLSNHGAPAGKREGRRQRWTRTLEVIGSQVKIWEIRDRPCGI